MNRALSSTIINELRILIPNPVCELEFKNIFELTIAVVLSAQTTDKRVNIVTKELFDKYPSSRALAAADPFDVQQIIQSLGLAKAKTRSIIDLASAIEGNAGFIPNTLEGLMTLRGVGRKTASVILAVGYNIPAMPVDTHVYRVATRLGYIKASQSILEAEEALKRYIPQNEWAEAHHLFLLFGRYHCQSKKPKCDACPLKQYCKR